jgi:hypothetical protein
MARKARPATDAAHYIAHITAYEREFKKWEGRVEKIERTYRDDDRRGNGGQTKFNVLWSNVQTLKAATFARMPMPDVSRRFKDQDPVGRVAAMLLERSLEFEVQHYRDFGASIRQCVYDRFLGGRGTVWVRYEPTFKQGESPSDVEVTEDAETETDTAEELDFECAPVDYVHWRDFGHSVARTWEEVTVVWRRVFLDRAALDERFGDEAEGIPLDSIPDDANKLKSMPDSDSINRRALIYEIWDKSTGEAVWLAKSISKIIDRMPDPLGLEEFFPCPPPLVATLTTDSLVPLPDYSLYQDQAIELNVLADRIDGLVKMLQVKGVYDASSPELARLFTEGVSGSLIGVKNWAAFAEKSGLKGSLDVVDLTPIAAALKEAYLAFEQVKAQIYELTGISDIIRGDTQAEETATAQQIKNSYASMRLKTYQDEVERFAARILQLKAQIICNHFDAATIAQIGAADQLSQADQQYIPAALALLKNGVQRSMRIDVETDSMVYQNEQQEKADRMEFLGAVAQFLEKAVQAGTQAPQLVPLAVELLKFGVTGFRIGKSLEGTIDQAAELLKQQAAQPQPQQPNPDAIKAQSAQQIEQIRQQNEQARIQSDQAIEQARISSQAQLQAQAQQHEATLQAMKQQHEAAMAQMQQKSADTLQLILAHIKAASAVEVAEVAAQTTIDAAQISAAKQGAE